MKKYNKLIRDKIPEIIAAKGEPFKTRIAGEEEYRQKLKEKLIEEVNEFNEEENLSELADIMEVLYAICDYLDISRDDLEKKRKEKADQRGGFKKKIILDEA